MSHTTAVVSSGFGGGPPYRVVGAGKETTVDVTWSSNYATGGETVPLSELPLNVVNGVVSARVITPDAQSTAVEVDARPSTVGDGVVVKLNAAAAESADTLAITGLVVRLVLRGS